MKLEILVLLKLKLTRIASLDLMTHGTFGELTEVIQHDGDSALLRFDRYLGLRLAGVTKSLDANDVLVLMWDHGARSSCEHDVVSLLVLNGAMFDESVQLEEARALGGVPWLVANLLGVDVDCPDGGFARLLVESAGTTTSAAGVE